MMERKKTMLDTQEIRPLTDFLRNHKAHVARLKETKTPEILTVNGKAEVIVQDAQSYQELLDRLHHMETIAAIREGIASAERGELKPAEQVFAEMKAKYGIPD
jgi:hypothetical protein